MPVASGTFTMVVKLLAVLCRNCPSLALELLENTDIQTILRDVLSGTPLSTAESKEDLMLGSPSHMTRPSEQLSELLSLSVELLPPLPKSEVFASASQDLVPTTSSSSGSLKNLIRPKSKRKDKGSAESSPVEEKSKSSATSRGEEADGVPADPRVKFLKDNIPIMAKFTTLLLPVLVDVFATTVSPLVRQNW